MDLVLLWVSLAYQYLSILLKICRRWWRHWYRNRFEHPSCCCNWGKTSVSKNCWVKSIDVVDYHNSKMEEGLIYQFCCFECLFLLWLTTAWSDHWFFGQNTCFFLTRMLYLVMGPPVILEGLHSFTSLDWATLLTEREYVSAYLINCRTDDQKSI